MKPISAWKEDAANPLGGPGEAAEPSGEDCTRDRCAAFHQKLDRLENRERLITRIAAQSVRAESVNNAVEELGRYLDADRVLVLSIDPADGTYGRASEWAAPGMEPFGQALCEGVVKPGDDLLSRLRQKQVVVENRHTAPAVQQRLGTMRALGAKSALLAPLFANEELWGVLAVADCRAPRRWPAEELRLCANIAKVMSVGIGSRQMQRSLVEKVTAEVHSRRLLEKRDQELKEALAGARRASEAKSVFVWHISHEIRTPLAAITGLAQLAEEEEDLAQVRRYLVDMRAAGDVLAALVNNVLDMARIEADKLVPAREVFSLQELLERVNATVALRAAQKNHRLAWRVPEGLARYYRGDPALLTQVLVNLLGNAVKFTPEGGALCLEVCSRAGRLVFAVQDDGPGIRPEDLGRLFEPFMQADPGARRPEGSGLGLPIAHSLVAAMGGRLQAASTVGQGSRFSFDLPLQAVPSREWPRPAGKAAGRPAPELAGVRVLLCEDQPVNREVVRRFLHKAGAHTQTAANGLEAVRRFTEARGAFDLVLMDLSMPVMDGLEAAAELRRLQAAYGRRAPILALTASAFQEDIQRCLAAGMDGHLAKPIQRQTLLAELQRWLGEGAGTGEGRSQEGPQPPAGHSGASQGTNAPAGVPAASPKASPPAAVHRAPQPAAPAQDRLLWQGSRALPCIDLHAGLSALEGDRAAYHELLRKFKANNDLLKISTALAEGDLAALAGHLHAMKGVAGTLALRRLAQEAGGMETALGDQAAMLARFDALHACYLETIGQVDRLLQQDIHNRGRLGETAYPAH